MTQPGMSKHLRVLREVGLVRDRKAAKQRFRATVRLRQRVTKGPGSRAAGVAMAFQSSSNSRPGIDIRCSDVFSRAVIGETAFDYPIEDAIANMRVIDAVLRSGQSGRWETLRAGGCKGKSLQEARRRC